MNKTFLKILFLIICCKGFGQWTTLNSGTSAWLGTPFFITQDTGFVVGSNGVILKTANAGLTWTQIQSNTTKNLSKLIFTDSNTGYIIGQDGTFLKTIDKGNSWSNISFQQSHLYDISFVSSQIGYVIGANGAVYQTLNGGVTWSNKSVSLNSWFTCHFFNSVKGLIGGINDMRITNDGGNTWTQINQGKFYYIYDNSFLNDTLGYLLELRYYGRSLVYKTIDGGLTWTDSTEIVKGQIESIQFLNSNVGYAVGGTSSGTTTSSYVFKTINGGQSWTQQNAGTNNLLSQVFFLDQNTGYAAGSNGTIIKTQNGGVGLNKYSRTISVNIFPNPIVNDKLFIEGPIDDYKIELFDNIGNKIFNSVNSNFIDFKEFSKGIYILKITNIHGQSNYKIIKD